MSLITLIRPPTVVPFWAHTSVTCPPIGMAYLASSLQKAGHQVEAIDSIGESVFQMTPIKGTGFLAHGLSSDEIVDRVHPSTDFLGVSCMFSNEWPLARELIRKLRRRYPDKPIIGGGEHFTSLPEWTLESCPDIDYCVSGEGEEKLVHLIHELSLGREPSGITGIHSRPVIPGQSKEENSPRDLMAARLRDVDAIPPPAWDLFPLSNYLDNEYGFGVNRGRSMPMLATRGCPYQCTFCSSPQMWTTRWIARDPRKVLEEMESYLRRYRIDNFDFYDMTAIVRRKWIIEFCELIIRRGLRFTWQLPSGTRSEAIDKEVSGLLYESGCRNLSYAPESGSSVVLKRVKKKVNLKKMKDSIRDCVHSGLNVKCNIIMGFPGETHFEVLQTLWFMAELAVLGLHDISVSPYTPYPGSELYHELTESGKISKFTDDYFWSLTAYTDLTKTISWSENISDVALSFYRLFGMFLFYAVNYTLRPWRFLRTLKNSFSKRQESRLEMTIRDALIRLFPMRHPQIH